MFQIAQLITSRIAISSQLATLAITLGGCAGLDMGGAQSSRALSGGYKGDETLAVLLPETGRFASAASVVREGIVAAQAADPQGKRPTLRFYDSASGSVGALVKKAAADGAVLAIGPLQKPAVEKLAAAPTLPIPVLALNLAPGASKPPQNLYQFALSPEGEAADVASKAWGQGHRAALMLYPAGDWGSRISRAFSQAWKARGGTLAEAQSFPPSAADFSATVAKLSEGSTDADFVFLVATAKDARRIWPQIRHKLGTEMPVYSTSHIYSGHFDPKNDKGLVGLNFVEIPWLVEPARGDAVSAKGLYSKLPRLYAMGVDAYRLGSRLEWMSANPQARVQGKTGVLGMDSRRRIDRTLTLARIDATGPVKTAATDDAQLRSPVRADPLDEVGPRIAAVGPARLARIGH